MKFLMTLLVLQGIQAQDSDLPNPKLIIAGTSGADESTLADTGLIAGDGQHILDNTQLIQALAIKIQELEGAIQATKQELDDTKAGLEGEIQATKQELDDTKAELEANKEELDDNKAGLEGKIQATKQELDDTKAELEATKQELDDNKADLDVLDGRVAQTQEKSAVCGYRHEWHDQAFGSIIQMEVIHSEVDTTGSSLGEDGIFTAGAAGVYFITANGGCRVNSGEDLYIILSTSSGSYQSEAFFIQSGYSGGYVSEQCSGSRFVKLSKGETVHLQWYASGSPVLVEFKFCISLYSRD